MVRGNGYRPDHTEISTRWFNCNFVNVGREINIVNNLFCPRTLRTSLRSAQLTEMTAVVFT